MPRFNDVIEAARGNADADMNTIYADLTTAYDEDLAEALSIPGAKIAETESALAEAQAEISRLKAHNYDLLTSVQAGPTDADDTELINEDEDTSEITTDDLFDKS